MAFEVPNDTVKGRAISALLAPKVTAAAGAGANTNIAIAGITTQNQLVSVLLFTAGVPSVITSSCSITSNGNIQSTGATTGNTLVVTWV